MPLFLSSLKTKYMQVVKQWNAISDELKNSIPQFDREEVKSFRMLNGKKNDQEGPRGPIEREKNPILYPRTQIPTKDRIFDPYKNAGKGGYVDIIVSEGWADDEPTRPKLFLPGDTDYRFNGKFALTGSSIGDQELFEYLWLTNYRGDNPNRDKTVQPLFEYIDVKKESAMQEATEDEIYEAGVKVRTLNEDQARKVGASLNFGSDMDYAILLANLKSYARQDPKHFMQIANTSEKILSSKSDIKAALDSGVLSFDTTTGRLTNKSVLLANFEVNERFVLLDEVSAWLASAANGEEILKSIRKQLKK